MRFAIIAIAACAVLVACSPTPASTEAAGEPTATTEAAAQPVSGEAAQLLVGRWGDNGDCTKDLVLAADGTFRSYTGGGGTWSVEGDILTMTGAAGAFQVRIQSLNDHQLLVQNPDGSIGLSQRC
jgi:hypothetical protein